MKKFEVVVSKWTEYIIEVEAESKEQAENIGRCSASPDNCVSGVDATAEEVDALSHLDIGSIDPESYQQQEDDGCEGGACKI